MRAQVLIPTYNEAENIQPLIEAIFEQGDHLTVLVVDDDSPDGTARLAEEVGRGHPGRVEVMLRTRDRGRGLAGIAGFRRLAEKPELDAVVEMDADFSHDPRAIPGLLAALEQADVAIGSRYCAGGAVVGWGLKRYVNSWLANRLTQAVLGLWPYRDCTSGYRVYRREVLQALDWDRMISDNPSIVEEVLYACHAAGFRVVEVPIRFVDRTRGSSKLSLVTVARCSMNLFRIRWRGPNVKARDGALR
ncbi:MAG: polyprenol monophosphomannose synthase [Armatimonadetes bacterium]|nr:polyprenol monophosphomannose synthase [Armatimonadota bacterium]